MREEITHILGKADAARSDRPGAGHAGRARRAATRPSTSPRNHLVTGLITERGVCDATEKGWPPCSRTWQAQA